MKTSELTGLALDWAVAKCEGLKLFDRLGVAYIMDPRQPQFNIAFEPSTDWAQGGPIIEREIHAFDHMQSNRVTAIIKRKDMNNGGFTHGYGPTPLIAAMRCYVASKLGDEIDIPKELVA